MIISGGEKGGWGEGKQNLEQLDGTSPSPFWRGDHREDNTHHASRAGGGGTAKLI